jgi:hypothetical protein
MTLALGAYFFLMAFVLAHLEIQIEGPHGWAEKLPTWRWDGPGVRRWFGKPITGYHLCLITFILLFLHVPQFYGASWAREADLLAMFFFLSVTWDVLWFACNRHFGIGRFRKGQVWWFPAWSLGVPRPYLLTLALSLVAALAPALGTGAWMDRAHSWALVFIELVSLTTVAIAVARLRRRHRHRRVAAQAAHR